MGLATEFGQRFTLTLINIEFLTGPIPGRKGHDRTDKFNVCTYDKRSFCRVHEAQVDEELAEVDGKHLNSMKGCLVITREDGAE